MKLAEWAKKQGISYLTAYRWFRDGKLPVKAYQSDSGTIIVQDESTTNSSENLVKNTQSNDVMSIFLKKTVEFSVNGSPIEDFAAWVLSNFSLKPLGSNSGEPKYSKIKPKPEAIQEHFKKFIKPKGDKPKPFMAEPSDFSFSDSLEADSSFSNDLKIIDNNAPPIIGSAFYSTASGGEATQNISLTQPTNYTSSSYVNDSLASTFSTLNGQYTDGYGRLFGSVVNEIFNKTPYGGLLDLNTGYRGEFQLTNKELESTQKAIEVKEKPKRGRKPFKNTEKL